MTPKQRFIEEYAVIVKQDVIWGDMDAFNHVNNTVYFRYFEDARMAFFEKTGVMPHMEATNIGPILASTQCQFRAPVSFPDRILIGARIKEISEKRFTMEYGVFSEQHETLAAKGEGMVVYYNYKLNESCEIPDEIRVNFNQLQAAKHH
ncbi:acyl-CoA thioesterase [Bermanella sp. WJH001]|jgi:acyl-CoA thioester hydrolase|uniref:acyl-CoA thioesterase n=1 Tax=Bermanella sp. WJH001 TaxID=3048005 RepID=UPI0024BD9A33|nr:thioesterase family protein [Bermanella sp. WJH001]MDJ1536882.1 thioesterase family protein [Bermanella sp. WJH001]